MKAVTPAQYKELMRTPLVFDGRNLHGVAEMKNSGVEYHSVGRSLKAAGQGDER